MCDYYTTMGNSDLEFLNRISKKLTTKVLHEVLVKVSNTKEVTLDGWKETVSENKKGDSYLSILYRFNIFGTLNENGKKLDIPVVVKGFPHNIGRQKTFRSAEFFATEIKFYEVWDQLLTFQKEMKVEKIFSAIPRCLASLADGENDYLILEDVSALGFKALTREVTLDMNYCNLIMRLFAGFHATSFAFKNLHPEKYEKLVVEIKETYFKQDLREWYKNFMYRLFDIWNDALEKEIPGSKYEQKFHEFIANDFYGTITELVENKNQFAVLSQGDAWVPNFLLKHSENNIPEEALLIDFQLARNSSPVLDLSFFLFSCVDPEIRKEHWNDLLQEYHNEFIAHIRQFGLNDSLFPLSALHDEFCKYGKFGIGMCLEALPFSMMNDEDVQDLDNIKGEDKVDIASVWLVKPLDTKEKRMRLVKTVIEQVDRGFI